MKAKRSVSVLVVLAALVVTAGWLFYQPDLPYAYLKGKYTTGASRFMNLEGMRVHYRVEGAGPPLLLLHGTSSSLQTWDGWVAVLKGRYKIIRLDLPGFGLTGPNRENDYRIARYVKFLAGFLDRLGMAKTALAGNSLGGGIAHRFAAAHPGRVTKLILIDPSGLPIKGEPPLFMRLAANPALQPILKRMGLSWLVEKTLRKIYGDPKKVTPSLVARYWELSLRPGNRGALAARVAQHVPGDPNLLKRITAPTLVMWGGKDPWIPAAQAKRYARLIPRCRVILYPKIGHVPMEEIPRKTAQDAAVFLGG